MEELRFALQVDHQRRSLTMIQLEQNSAANGNAHVDGEGQPVPRLLCLELPVRDPEVICELVKLAEGPEREEYALAALRLGVLALRQANGVVDAQAVRTEGDRLVGAVRELLVGHAGEFFTTISTTLSQYFDPAKGDLPQRLERLIKKDGDLEGMLCRHLDGEASTLARTLTQHLGEQSPIFRLLSPSQSEGILAALTSTLETALQVQREHILGQFSLDDANSALSRLVSELTDTNGQLKKDLTEDLTRIRSEFSLDNRNGALFRLVARVEKARKTIIEQFSQDNEDSALCRLSRLLENTSSKVESSLTLDDEKSPLSRLRRELFQAIENLTTANKDFHGEVRETLAVLKARREEAARGTAHGLDFQEAVKPALRSEAQRLGDIFEDTCNKTGRNAYCKKGDFVISLGPDSAASGARIVCEAKEDRSYDVPAALTEIHEARENRNADLGIFIFSKAAAPEGMELLARHGQDVLVIWDRDDPNTDILLRAALSIARAIAVRERAAKAKSAADFDAIDQALAKIAKDAEQLADIDTWAGTIQKTSRKILDRVQKVRDGLDTQVERLREHVERFREPGPAA
jgi:hypothetical protein